MDILTDMELALLTQPQLHEYLKELFTQGYTPYYKAAPGPVELARRYCKHLRKKNRQYTEFCVHCRVHCRTERHSVNKWKV